MTIPMIPQKIRNKQTIKLPQFSPVLAPRGGNNRMPIIPPTINTSSTPKTITGGRPNAAERTAWTTGPPIRDDNKGAPSKKIPAIWFWAESLHKHINQEWKENDWSRQTTNRKLQGKIANTKKNEEEAATNKRKWKKTEEGTEKTVVQTGRKTNCNCNRDSCSYFRTFRNLRFLSFLCGALTCFCLSDRFGVAVLVFFQLQIAAFLPLSWFALDSFLSSVSSVVVAAFDFSLLCYFFESITWFASRCLCFVCLFLVLGGFRKLTQSQNLESEANPITSFFTHFWDLSTFIRDGFFLFWAVCCVSWRNAVCIWLLWKVSHRRMASWHWSTRNEFFMLVHLPLAGSVLFSLLLWSACFLALIPCFRLFLPFCWSFSTVARRRFSFSHLFALFCLLLLRL